MMKVLYYAPFPKKRNKGGITVVATSLKENLHVFKENNIDVEFFNCCPVERVQNTSGKLHITNLYNYFITKKNIRELLIKSKFDIIHICTSVKLALLKDLLLVRFIKGITKGKILLHIRFCDIDSIFYTNKLLRKYMINSVKKNVDAVITLSKKFRGELINAGLSEDKIHVLYNTQNTIKEVFQLPENKVKRLLFMASIDSRKGILDLLEALNSQEKDKYTLSVCGVFHDEKFKKLVYDKLEENELQNNVSFLGYVEGIDKERLMIESDILLLPSYGEGLPISILEAMAAGCAIISTTVGGIPEIVNHEENGYLIQPGDIKDLREKIKLLITEDSLLNRIKENNIINSKRFDIKQYILNSKELYQKVLDS